MGRFSATRPVPARLQAASAPAPPQVADPRRGTGLVVSYAAVAVLLVLAGGAWRGFVVDLPSLELTALVALAACAGQISVLVGPRTWYTPTTPIIVLAGLVGGPLAGALTGAATEAMGTSYVWRQRLMGASRSAIEGFAAGLAGLLPLAGANGSFLRVVAASSAAFALAQIARSLVVHVREIRPAGAAIRAGASVDAVEAILSAPILAALVSAQTGSPLVAVTALASIVGVLAVAERAHHRQAEQLERERTVARTDTLTSAPNRLALDEALVLEHGRIVRGARPAGLFIVDLDHFKQVNDVHGHDVGDAVLVETVDRLRAGLRDMDLVGRWGGDELIVLAPDVADIDALEVFGDRIRRLVCEAHYAHPDGGTLVVSASVGGTLLDGATSPEVVLKRADVAVYRAKQSRNATVVEVPVAPRASLSAVFGTSAAGY